MFILISVSAFFFRYSDYCKISGNINGILPFESYSAQNYSTVINYITQNRTAAKTKSPSLMEYLIAEGYKFFYMADSKSINIQELHNFIRVNLRLFISISAGIIFLILTALNVSFMLSLLGAVLFVVCPASVVPANGLNFTGNIAAVPFIMLFYLFFFLYIKKKNYILLILLSIVLFIALSISEFSQLNLYFFALYLIIYNLIYLNKSNNNFHVTAAVFFTSLAASFLIPSLQNIGYIAAPVNTLFLPAALFLSLLSILGISINTKKKYIISFSLLAVTPFIWIILFHRIHYIQNYSLVIKLFLNKLYYWNIKPVNPEKLDIALRILWNSPFRSASFNSYWRLFHLILYSLISAFFITFLSKDFTKNFVKNFKPYLLLLLIGSCYFVLFVFFVKISICAAAFICILLALTCNGMRNSVTTKLKRRLIACFFTLLVVTETFWCSGLENRRWFNIKTNSALVNYLLENEFCQKIVLADYTFSSMISAYCDLKPVLKNDILQNGNLDKIEEYYRIIYTGTEKQLYKFCRKNMVEYFIFFRNMKFENRRPERISPYSKKYIADVSETIPGTPVYKISETPLKLNTFYLIDNTAPYYISNTFSFLKFISKTDIKLSKKLILRSSNLLRQGRLKKAKNTIKKAIELYPASPEGRFLYFRIFKKWPRLTLSGVTGQKLSH